MTTKEDCLFCKIVEGVEKSYLVWENEQFMAFLTIFPNTRGFTVVIPKQHYSSYIFKAPADVVHGLIDATKEVSAILERGLKVERCAVVFEGYGINHLHAKLIPLHGTVPGEWQAIESKNITTYFDSYPGYISSHDAPRWTDEMLSSVLNEIHGIASVNN